MTPQQQSLSPVLDLAKFKSARAELGTKSSIEAIPDDQDGIRIDPFKITVALTAVACVLVLISVAVQFADHMTGYSSVFVHKLMKLTNVDLELNVPAFFSTLILLIASLLLAVVTDLKRREKARYVWHWALLSAGFLFMAFDETASIHERLIEPVRTLFGEVSLGVLYFAWVVPALVLLPFLAIVFLRFFISLPANIKLGIFAAAVLYLGAAIGLELIEGSHVELYGKENLPYIALATLEETLEMVGIIVFIRTLLVFLGDSCKKRLQFRIDNQPGTQPL